MKIKTGFGFKRYIVGGVSVFAIAGLVVSVCIYNGGFVARAHEDDDLAEIGGASDLGSQYNEENEITSGTGEGFAEEYNARVEYNVRNKHQHSEGMCWLYSNVTALEYALAKKYGEYYEVSTKHLDYIAIDGRYVYKQNNKTNVYFDRYLSVDGAFHRVDLGTSGANEQVVYGMLNPLSIVSESDFTDVLKNNDSRLAKINRYDDIWNNAVISASEKNEILELNAEGRKSYMVKQDYDKVNDASKVKYVVTGAKMLGYGFDGSRTADNNTVKTVKKLIRDYGAVKVSAFGTSNKFENCSYKKETEFGESYTFIVDGRVINDDLKCSSDHGMTIIGWKDDWTYEYNGEEKRGAFILQNSWGENDEEEKNNPRWYLGYISALPDMMYFDSIDEYDDYDYYYGPDDYSEQKNEPDSDELVFTLSLNDNAKIKAFTFGDLSGTHDYAVYVSDNGESSNFEYDGNFSARSGITKYIFNKDYDIDGDYAIKLKRLDAGAVSSSSRSRGTLNVMASKVLPEDEKENEDGRDGGEDGVKDEKEELMVPSTSTEAGRAIAPETGANTVEKQESDNIFSVLPIAFGFGAVVLYLRYRNKGHRKFEQ